MDEPKVEETKIEEPKIDIDKISEEKFNLGYGKANASFHKKLLKEIGKFSDDDFSDLGSDDLISKISEINVAKKVKTLSKEGKIDISKNDMYLEEVENRKKMGQLLQDTKAEFSKYKADKELQVENFMLQSLLNTKVSSNKTIVQGQQKSVLLILNSEYDFKMDEGKLIPYRKGAKTPMLNNDTGETLKIDTLMNSFLDKNPIFLQSNFREGSGSENKNDMYDIKWTDEKIQNLSSEDFKKFEPAILAQMEREKK